MENTKCAECETVIFKEHILHTEKSCPSEPCGNYWIANYYSRGATYCHETRVPDGEAVCYGCRPDLKNDIDLSQLQLIQESK
tara:strand:+ start:148 stop:393 length:246 start_codon:yes stop_codon:yes gene_type:complete